MRTIVVGDVHGCPVELDELLATLRLDPADHLIFCGDLLDKGPDSPAVVRRVRGLSDAGQRLTLVAGNHEAKHARFRKHERRKLETGEPNPITKGAEEMLAITAALSAADIAFLEEAVLYCPLPEHRSIVVHAGVPPSVKSLPPLDVLRQMSRKDLDRYLQLLRVRHVNARGWMVALGEETEADPFWSDVYEGRFGHVYFGHQPYLEPAPRRSDYATGIDLGCVFGNLLCAAILEVGHAPRFELVQAHATYAKSYWE